MNRTVIVLLNLGLLAAATVSQQPNGARASMLFNGINGPPYPIAPVPFPRGTTQAVQISGLPNSLFIAGGSDGLRPSGMLFPPGLVDIDFVNYLTVWDGTADASFTLDGTGQWTAFLPIPATLPVNQSRAFQGVVADFTSPAGATLTAATQVVIVAGISATSLVLGGDDSASFDLAPFGFGVPFYSGVYSNVWVNSNGSLSFNQGSADFNAVSVSFLGDMPRIAGFWTDLQPDVAGTITMIVDQSTSIPFLRCEFANVAEFNIQTPHSFSMTVYSQIGDVVIAESGFNPQPLIQTLVGISPGGNLSTLQAHPVKDLSTLTMANYPATGGLVGAANENFHEIFPPGIGWDLAGRTITCFGLGAGVPGASYRVLTSP